MGLTHFPACVRRPPSHALLLCRARTALGRADAAAAPGRFRPPTATPARTIFARRGARDAQAARKDQGRNLPIGIATVALVIWLLYPSEEFRQLERLGARRQDGSAAAEKEQQQQAAQTAWAGLTTSIAALEWSAVPDAVAGFILPEWATLLPGYVRKLQAELSMAPGSLADDIWAEAHDPFVNPEIRYAAAVRVSSELCDEEKEFLERRRRVARVALAKYLGLPERDVHADDVPVIALCGSGGGLRALVAGTGSLLATEEDGLFDCVTYTAGVSGSCWLQMLYHSSFAACRLQNVLEHIKARAGIHIAYPPEFFQALVMAPTNKYLLSGIVEKLRGDPKADFGLVDVYGLLLAARYLVPKGELDIDARDFKLSNQRRNVQFGQNPLPIYTAVRHEIPGMDPSLSAADKAVGSATEAAKELAKQESWFQWFEVTPYEFFCEEFSAGIPTWAVGRQFRDGVDIPPEHGFHLPEIRTPLLMGIFGSAFCATLSHYYREVRPLVQSLTGFAALDEMIAGRNEDLSKVHPIDPATVPNFACGMYGKLPSTTPESVFSSEHIQLMDAGMSNNLPIYPLLRPGRNVDILIAFDASADTRTDNWLSVADGYARKRNIKGWPVGIGWPKKEDSPAKTEQQLTAAQAGSSTEAAEKLEEAQVDQTVRRMEAATAEKEKAPEESKSKAPDPESPPTPTTKFEPGEEEAGDLGYCTIWVGSTEEVSSSSPSPSASDSPTSPESSSASASSASSSSPSPPPSSSSSPSRARPLSDSDPNHWSTLSAPNAGLAVIYLPFLSNDAVPAIHPGTTECLSTWNFVYTPEQIDAVVALARANYDEGRDRIRRCVRAVYDRKKRLREEHEAIEKRERYRRLMRRGMAHRLGEGDQFS